MSNSARQVIARISGTHDDDDAMSGVERLVEEGITALPPLIEMLTLAHLQDETVHCDTDERLQYLCKAIGAISAKAGDTSAFVPALELFLAIDTLSYARNLRGPQQALLRTAFEIAPARLLSVTAKDTTDRDTFMTNREALQAVAQAAVR